MEDKLGSALNRYNNDLYNSVAEQVVYETDDFTSDSGVIICKDAAHALLAQTILSDYYNTAIKPLRQESEYDLVYHVTYDRDIEEAINGKVKKNKRGYDFGLGGIKFYPEKGTDKAVANFNRMITPSGEMHGGPVSGGDGGAMAGGMGESFDEPEAETVCPFCGGSMSLIGNQGNYWEFNCNDCNEWAYLDSEQRFHKANDVWDEGTLNEANGDDSFYAAQSSMSRKATQKQKDKLEAISNDLRQIGDFRRLEVEQLIPRNDSHYNVTFDLLGMGPSENPEDDKAKIVQIFDKHGAQVISVEQYGHTESNKFGKMFYCWGFAYIPGMTLGKGDIEEAIENHDELNPDLFDGDELKPEVKEKLLEIADKFKKNLKDDGIRLNVKDIQIVGSNAGYNYTDDSDIDLHLIADLSVYGDIDLAQKLYDARKALWNDKYDPTIYGHEVELYVEPEVEVDLDEAISKGAYSLLNGWVAKPAVEDHNDIDIEDELQDYIYQAEHCESVEDIDEFLDRIYDVRQKSLLDSGEWSTGNLIFKELRNNGILQDLKDKKVNLLNKEMSL